MTPPRTLQASHFAGEIRPFREEHTLQVAELHHSVFATARSMPARLVDQYESFLREAFLNQPHRREDLSSLVYEEAGNVMGFCGSMARPMRINGKPVIARVTSSFAVDPRRRGVVGVNLLRAVLNGPQDLTIADESNTSARKIWEALGGTTAKLYSFIWTYPLGPCGYALSMISRHGGAGRVLAAISAPGARSVDWLVKRSPFNPYQPREPRLAGEEMDTETLLNTLSGGVDASLQPVYDRKSLEWALGRAARFQGRGTLQKVIVKSKNQETAGWYVSYANPGGVEEVLQISAKPAAARDVFDHLLYNAQKRGAVAVTGRLDPSLMESCAERRCLLRCGPWVLVHSRHAELTQAFHQGTAFFSRLDGEWCLHLH